MKIVRLAWSVGAVMVVAFGALPAATKAALRLEIVVQPAYTLGDPILVGLRLVNDGDRKQHAQPPLLSHNLYYVVETNEGEALPCMGCSIALLGRPPRREFGPEIGVTRVLALGFFYQFQAGTYVIRANYEELVRSEVPEQKRADSVRLETSAFLEIKEPASAEREELLEESLAPHGVLRGIGSRGWASVAEAWPSSPLRQYIVFRYAKSDERFEVRERKLRDFISSSPSFRFRQMAELALCESRLSRGNADEECSDEVLSRLSDPLVKDRAAALLAEHGEPPTAAPR